MARLAGIAFVVAVVVTALIAQGSSTEKPQKPAAVKGTKNVSDEERMDALMRAQVWRAPAAPVATARLGGDPKQPKFLSCRFRVTDVSGTAAKFDCTLDNGEEIRVKYGRTPEIPSEVAAARLLHAIGFGADEMMLVEKLRCYGCPIEPFVTLKAVDLTETDGLLKKIIDYNRFKDFEWVAVEQKHKGRAIGTDAIKGWAFFELDTINPAKGGAPRAHVDALRLMAVFLAHWDNKSENQRLVCLSAKDWPDGGRCARPFALMQDVGGAFGPRKVDLEGWEKAPIWADRSKCIASMDSLPYKGATFKAVTITEAGRRHLATLLDPISDQQAAALFAGARFDHSTGLIPTGPASPTADWVRVFKRKVREISDGPACPQ